MAVPQERYQLIEWPEKRDQEARWKIIRASHLKPTKLMCFSSFPLWCKTHFWMRRTTPCMKKGCQACDAGYSPRVNGYLLAHDVEAKRDVLVEFTGEPAADLQTHIEKWGTLRGFNMVLGRVTKKNNGKVYISVKGMNDGAHGMGPEEGIWPVMCHIFGLNKEGFANIAAVVHNNLENSDQVGQALEYAGQSDDSDWMNARVKPAAEQLALSLPGLTKVGGTINSHAMPFGE